MPRPQFRLDSRCERCFLNALVQLKKMRVCLADSNPDYLYDSFGWKSSHAFDRKEKCPELNPVEFFTQRKLDILGDVREKTEGEMHLIDGSPTDAADARIELNQDLPDRFWRIN